MDPPTPPPPVTAVVVGDGLTGAVVVGGDTVVVVDDEAFDEEDDEFGPPWEVEPPVTPGGNWFMNALAERDSVITGLDIEESPDD